MLTLPRETLRQYLGKEVEVLAVYGRVRRFTVGLSSTGELIEITPEDPEGFTESIYATIREVPT